MENKLADIIELFVQTPFRVEGVYKYAIEPGSHGKMKTAPYPGFIFPLSGQAEFDFSGTLYTASAGTVIHGGANMELEKRVLGKDKWKYILVMYSLEPNPKEEQDLSNMHFELKTGESPRLTDLLQKLSSMHNQPGAHAAFRTETLFRRVLDEVFTCAQSQTGGTDQLLFEQVSEYIHAYYMDTLTIRALAEMHGVNENRLFYVFSKYAGMGAGDYLMIHRLNRAKELLVTGDAPIVAVAQSVGYQDPYHFSKRFKKQFGLSPSKFRQTYRKQ